MAAKCGVAVSRSWNTGGTCLIRFRSGLHWCVGIDSIGCFCNTNIYLKKCIRLDLFKTFGLNYFDVRLFSMYIRRFEFWTIIQVLRILAKVGRPGEDCGLKMTSVGQHSSFISYKSARHMQNSWYYGDRDLESLKTRLLPETIQRLSRLEMFKIPHSKKPC